MPNRERRSKFQADLAPADDRTMRALKQELHVASNTDFLADALALFSWAVSERRMGNRIVSETLSGEKRVLVFPRLERIAPAEALPQVDLDWSKEQLTAMGKILTSKAKRPPAALIRALKD